MSTDSQVFPVTDSQVFSKGRVGGKLGGGEETHTFQGGVQTERGVGGGVNQETVGRGRGWKRVGEVRWIRKGEPPTFRPEGGGGPEGGLAGEWR